MTVVAAGVHFAGVGGGEIVGGFLRDGKGVAIRPEGNGVLRAEIKKGAQAAFYGRKNGTPQSRQSMAEIVHGFGKL